MTWTIPSVTATLFGTFLLTLVYWYIFTRYRERYLYLWSVSWTFYTLRFVFELMMQFKIEPVFVLLGHQFTNLISGFFLLWGICSFLGKPMAKGAIVTFCAGVLWVLTGALTGFSWEALNLPTFVFLGYVNLWMGIVFLKSGQVEGLGKYLTGWGFILWGIHKINYPFLNDISGFAPWGYFIAAFLEIVVAAGTMFLYFERTRKDLGASQDRFRRIVEALERYQLLCDHARDIILFFTRDGWIIEANDAAVKAYGYTRKELSDMNVLDLRAPECKSQLPEQLKEDVEEGILFETSHQRKDGSIFPVEVNSQGTFLDGQRVLLAIVRDIGERKRAEETINHLAFHDPLTDLPNRILFFDRLGMAISRANRNKQMLAVMFLDLDRFKYVNDLMGHAAGDKLLKSVAKKLKRCIRANDTVARMGGDEFTVLLPEVKREQDAARVAKKILDTLKRPWLVSGYEFQITTSIGIALYPNDGLDKETLTKNADIAMYRAKEMRDTYQFYTPAMNDKAVERMETERDLRRALEREEFEVYYQPQVNTSSGKILGVEALLRWNHPERGLVSPMEFIAPAEDIGLIVPIGEWVIRKACHQVKQWQKAGAPPLRLAVNLSALQFRQKQLVDMIDQVLEESDFDPRCLELEITESTAMQDVDFTIGILQKLRDKGIGIAIDDFGTGYSSLNYLRRFPITTLKVDRSFVRDVLSNHEDAAIVATIIVLAQNLKLKIIVEGVETKAQMNFFENHRCYEMQGHLFSVPVPAGEIEKLLSLPIGRVQKHLKTVQA